MARPDPAIFVTPRFFCFFDPALFASKLLELGIAEKEESGKVFVPWDEIDVQFPLQRLAA